MKYAIEIDNLTKYYGKNRGVSHLSFQVPRGEIFGFLGPNGAGKSTTIRSLMGLISPDEGSITVLGIEAGKHQVEMLRRVGYMPSEAWFYPAMRVREIIRLAADMRKMNCGHEAAMLCERLEVPLNKRIDELSLGNRKKVSIVCAMQHCPELFVFDEPTSGLDPLMQAEFFKLVKEYQEKGTTCFLSSHGLGEVRKYCRHVAIIKGGELICTDRVDHLTKTNAKHIRMVMDGEEKDFMYHGDFGELFEGFAGHHISDIVIEEPALEEIFMHFYA